MRGPASPGPQEGPQGGERLMRRGVSVAPLLRAQRERDDRQGHLGNEAKKRRPMPPAVLMPMSLTP